MITQGGSKKLHLVYLLIFSDLLLLCVALNPASIPCYLPFQTKEEMHSRAKLHRGEGEQRQQQQWSRWGWRLGQHGRDGRNDQRCSTTYGQPLFARHCRTEFRELAPPQKWSEVWPLRRRRRPGGRGGRESRLSKPGFHFRAELNQSSRIQQSKQFGITSLHSLTLDAVGIRGCRQPGRPLPTFRFWCFQASFYLRGSRRRRWQQCTLPGLVDLSSLRGCQCRCRSPPNAAPPTPTATNVPTPKAAGGNGST